MESAEPAGNPGPVAPAPAATTAPPRSRRSVPLVAFAVCGVGSIVLLVAAMRSPSTPPPVVAEAPVGEAARANKPQAAAVRSSATVASTPGSLSASRSKPVSRWTISRPPHRGYGNSIMFELAADADVAVWHNRVRPVLAVRCVAKNPEVFVMTYSAASIERDTRLHTIEMSFDDGSAVSQMWEHSVDHDALFAPDGPALAQQLAGARRMSFTFTPFNTPPVVASFSVAGLDQHLASAARVCGHTR